MPAEDHSAGEVDDLLAAVPLWAADERARKAAAERIRRRWLEHQAGEEETLAGVLVDLGEAGGQVAVTTAAGQVHRGRVAAICGDAVVLAGPDGRTAVLIPTAAIDSVAGADGRLQGAGGPGRTPPLSLLAADILAGWSAERPEVRLELRGGPAVTGVLRRVGTDVLYLVVGTPGRPVHVPLASLVACVRV